MRNTEDVIINGKTLEQILISHENWLTNDGDKQEAICADLSHADLSFVDLRGVDLRCANLDFADLSGADLSNSCLAFASLNVAYLIGTNLCSTNLGCASLRNAELYRANLNDADLDGANLSCASLIGTDLSNVNLISANLAGAVLDGANGSLIEYRKGKILTEPIIGYKKCKNDVMVTLEIPRGAIVFSINGVKCRTNKAKVINIDGKDRAYSLFDNEISYYVGDEITIYDFNCEYNIQCASGIHFFTEKEKAENYCY